MPGDLKQPYQNVNAQAFQFWGKPVLKANDGSLYCPGFEGPTYVANEWGYVTIYGYPFNPPLEENKTPGICEVSVTKYRDVDKKKAAGKDGARYTFHGIDPAMVEIRVTIWTPQQLYNFQQMWPVLFPKANKKDPTPFDVDHPMLRQHDIKSLAFTGLRGPDPAGIVNARVYTIAAVEYLQPGKKKATKTIVGTKGSILDDSVKRETPGSSEENTGP